MTRLALGKETMEATLIEELTEHFYEAHQKSYLGRWYLHAEKVGLERYIIQVQVNDAKSMGAFVDSTLKELEAIREAVFIIGARLSGEDGVVEAGAT